MRSVAMHPFLAMTSKLRRAGACVAVGLALWQAPAQAQTLDQDYWITAQAFIPRIDTSVQVTGNGSENIGTDIDMERDLGLDKDEVLPEVTAGARFGRVIVGLDYFRVKRTADAAIARDISFDDVTFPVSASVSSRFVSDIYRLTIGYAIVQNDNFELNAAIGVHATKFDTRLEGQVEIGEGIAETEVRRRDLLAPLPTIGAALTYKVAPRLELNGRFDWLSLKVDDYDGRLINTQASLTYKVLDNVGIGVAYRYVDYRVDVEKDRWTGGLRYKLHGPAIILQGSF